MTRALAAQAATFLEMGLTGSDAAYAGLARELAGVWLTLDGRAHDTIAELALSVDLSAGLPSDW
jgi:hypothetical protein